MQENIVFLGDQDEIHTKLVVQQLHNKPIIINTGRDTLSYKFEAHKTSWPTVLYDGKELVLEDVKSVWYRRTNVERLRPDLVIQPEDHRSYAFSSMQALSDGLLSLFHPGAFWVSHWQAIKMAEQKPFHLAIAQAVGFNVPQTLFSSDPTVAQRFVEERGVCGIKTLSREMPEGQNQYTQIRSGLDFRGLEVSPQIFQEVIRPKMEVRVAVIGNETFASTVGDTAEEKSNTSGIRDYRPSFRLGTFHTEPFALPDDLSKRCIELVRRLGTVCGFIDLILDDDQAWWFIENNPNGQWAFMDSKTVSRIATALARLLESGRSPWPSTP